MTTLYCKTRTGGWATHRPTATKTTKTGIPLYTLEEALALGYRAPAKPTPTQVASHQNLIVTIAASAKRRGDWVEIGRAVYQDGREVSLGFSCAISQRVRSFRKLGSERYTVQRFLRRGNDVHRVAYQDGLTVTSRVVPRDQIHVPLELKEQTQRYRSEWADDRLGEMQYLLRELTDGVVNIETWKGLQERPRAIHAWMQPWFNQRILESEKFQELYSFSQEWRRNRVPGDEAAFQAFNGWAMRDAHLAKIEEAHRRHAVNRRNDQFRKLAVRLAREAKGGSIQLLLPPKPEKGRKAPKAQLGTEEWASSERKFQSWAAGRTFAGYLESCLKREGVRHTKTVAEAEGRAQQAPAEERPHLRLSVQEHGSASVSP